MNTKIIGLTVTAVVAIILLGGVLMPTLKTAQDDAYHVYNNATNEFPLTYETAGDFKHHTITVDAGVYTVDGEIYELTSPMVMFGTNSAAGFNQTGGKFLLWSPESSGTVTAITITFDNGVMTTTAGSSTIEQSYSFLYILNDEGDYTYTTASSLAHVNADVDGWFIARNAAVGVWTYNNGELYHDGTESDAEVIITTTPAKYDTLTLSNVRAVTDSGPVQLLNGIVPTEVVATYSGGAQASALYGAIPVLIIVAIVVGVASVALRSRD